MQQFKVERQNNWSSLCNPQDICSARFRMVRRRTRAGHHFLLSLVRMLSGITNHISEILTSFVITL